MAKSIDILVAAALTVGLHSTASAEPCDTTPISFLGNSYIASLNHESRQKYAQNWGVERGNLVFEDSDKRNSDKQQCRKEHDKTWSGRKNNCDLFAYIGRKISDMQKELPGVIAEMKKIGSYRVVLYEGPNSLSTGNRQGYVSEKKRRGYKRQVKKQLEAIVREIHNTTINGKKMQIYIAKMPSALAGYSTLLDWEMISDYNKMISQVGADGVIETSDVPWKPADAHGYIEETFPYMLAKLHENLNLGCGYAKISSNDFLRIAYDRAAGKIRKRDYSKKVYAPYLKKVATSSGKR